MMMKKMFDRILGTKKVIPKCPDCGNTKHNREIKEHIWRCAACFRKFAVVPKDKYIKIESKEPVKEQIGVDVDEYDEEY